MKFYVAAKFDDKERVKEIYAMLRKAGHTITHEWVHNKPSYPFNLNPKFTAQCAQEDIDGVRKADVFVLLSNSEPSMGASTELGAAVASFLTFKRPYVFVIGPHFDTNFCFYHPVVIQKSSIGEVLQVMVTLKLSDMKNE